MVRHTLRPAIQRVESMACVRCRHDPFVVWLVQSFVDQWVMQAPVDPVDEEIRKEDEERNLQNIVEGKRGVHGCIVQLGIAHHFGKEERDRENAHHGHRGHSLPDLKPHLVLKVFWVREGGVVKYKQVGQ